MAYTAWSVVFGEQPSAAKWNILGTNDASFNDGTGIANAAITPAKRTGGFYVGNFTTSATGNKVITGVGFTPKLVLFVQLSASSATINNVLQGGMDNAGNQWANGAHNDQGGDNSGNSSTTNCLLSFTTDRAVVVAAAYTSMDSDGFTINISTHVSAITVGYIAFG